ncbi:hypothetical protein [Streptomyces albidus (ex Kaewkla and Franco 2022)]|uniref:hypothetical protein n=1 Tax=Streptomyces albidus (ex Kaewkla and Franco 2022) TaxID=722709 RepID=UPI002814E1E0|nr:hypothetical protein [Streptomyces albidus (ex Kaewkla and Franco 2022)]
MTAELEATREDLLAVQPADYEDSVNELQTEWEGRLRRLLRERPEVAGDLRRLLDELPAPETDTGTRVKQRATASGRGRVYQAGRDQHINER